MDSVHQPPELHRPIAQLAKFCRRSCLTFLFCSAFAVIFILDVTAADSADPAGLIFTIAQPLKWQPLRPGDHKLFINTPAKDIVAQEFQWTLIDLDGDGIKELVVQSMSRQYCVDGGCATKVIKANKGKPILLFDGAMPSVLGVTAQKENGYHHLAAIDAQGAIIQSDQQTRLFAKGAPMVYTMRADSALASAGRSTPGIPPITTAESKPGPAIDQAASKMPRPPLTLSPSDQAAAFKAAGFTLKGEQWRGCDDPDDPSSQGRIEEVRDLNGDGYPDAIVTEYSTSCYGNSGGASIIVSKQHDGSWKLITNNTGIYNFLRTKGVGGWPDIEIGGPGFCFPVARWNGQNYVIHRHEYEGKPCRSQ